MNTIVNPDFNSYYSTKLHQQFDDCLRLDKEIFSLKSKIDDLVKKLSIANNHNTSSKRKIDELKQKYTRFRRNYDPSYVYESDNSDDEDYDSVNESDDDFQESNSNHTQVKKRRGHPPKGEQ